VPAAFVHALSLFGDMMLVASSWQWLSFRRVGRDAEKRMNERQHFAFNPAD